MKRPTATPPDRQPAPAVRVAHLTKRFGDHTALDDVSFDLPSGQFLAVIGLSGSGKSTLLRLLNGLHTPSDGTVEVLGVDVVRARARAIRHLRCQVGFIFQQFNLVGRLSCMENVLSGALGGLRGPRLGVSTYSKALRRTALDHLDRVGLGHKAFQRADTLSGGEQQRVAIARSLMQRPQLLLADEPVASLDPESSGQVMDVLRRICVEEHLTVICSLHQVDMALGWAHRVIGLCAGSTVLDRPTGDLTRQQLMQVYQRDGVPVTPETPVADEPGDDLAELSPTPQRLAP
ncbi:phosphonate ABC transporter ATP-binding protein [Solwaraspora sp. WMMB762]|uniref:phosphonate ABC transporter ATP-binding protein n=1 Tax=Solwaraspora sp. WMMB762 TaxID=3404120 RepID=UPI003B940855